jgi:crossover junction endodeoxyribonuclease RuvC
VGNGAARPAGLADGSPGGVEPARALRIVALDLSLTATGYAMNTGHGVIEAPSVKRDSDLAAHWRRLREQRNRIRRVTGSADVVAIEGPAFSKGADPSAHERAGLWWTVVDHLLLNAIPVVVISPTGLKRYATGKGNASKAEVVAAAIRRLRYGGHDDNVADAMWLFQMAAAYYGQPHVEVPAPHRSALTAVAWPDLAMSA